MSDADLLLALLQAALALPAAVMLLALLAVFALQGLLLCLYGLYLVGAWLWKHRWWRPVPTWDDAAASVETTHDLLLDLADRAEQYLRSDDARPGKRDMVAFYAPAMARAAHGLPPIQEPETPA